MGESAALMDDASSRKGRETDTVAMICGRVGQYRWDGFSKF